MAAETVAVAADHAGYELKTVLKDELLRMGYEVIDLGTQGPASVDYPDFGAAAARAIPSASTASPVTPNPAVSTSVTGIPDRFTASVTKSRVVPAVAATIALARPTS